MQAEAKSRFRKYQKNFFFTSLIAGFKYGSRFLPRWFMRAAAHLFSIFFIMINMTNFRAVMFNMSTIFPGKSRLTIMLLAYGMFVKYAYYLIDLFYISHGRERIRKFHINYIGEEILYSVLNRNKGVILLTLHMGNWEMGGIALTEKGIPPPTIAYFPDSQDILESQRNRLRSLSSVQHVELEEGGFSAIKLLRILQEGGIIAIQGDRLQYDSGVEVEFFGHKALFPKGAIMLASAADAVILPTFMVMEGYNTYNIYVENPIEIKVYSRKEETLKENLKEIISVFEKYVKKYPDQWYTFMPFWSKDRESFKE